ncbi:ABC transporter permease [Marinomonas agarivorans]|nr:ABC transporter permease [Marinomonas agarivorans]
MGGKVVEKIRCNPMILAGKSIFIRCCVMSGFLLSVWEVFTLISGIPSFILPSPSQIFSALTHTYSLLIFHSLVTFSEIVIGLVLGCLIGVLLALNMLLFQFFRYWLLPVVLFSQAIPVFAIAPILVLWLGYGLMSKVMMSAIIIFFPILMTTFDGLRYTSPDYLNLAKTMGANNWQILLRIRLPAALPSFASGLRVAVVIAPIGAVIGEWVGASAGLGYYMLHSNARMQTADMFAALFILATFSILLYYLTDFVLKRFVYWTTESTK